MPSSSRCWRLGERLWKTVLSHSGPAAPMAAVSITCRSKAAALVGRCTFISSHSANADPLRS